MAGVAAAVDVRSAIGFSSFTVLGYYAVTNAAAWTLHGNERRWPRALSGLGFVGCLTLAVTLPLSSVVAGAGLLALGASTYVVLQRGRRREL